MLHRGVVYRAGAGRPKMLAMTNREPGSAGRRTTMTAMLAAVLLAACGGTLESDPDRAASVNDRTKEKPMTSRILIAMTSHDKKGDTGESTGAYVPEIAHPYAVFKREGFEVDFASVRGGRVPLDGVDRKDPVNAALLDDPHLMARLHESAASKDVDPSRYAAILFAGGHGTMWDFPDDPGFLSVAARIYDSGGVVAAVCHGPAALVNVRLSSGAFLVAGKTVSAFTNEEERAVKLDKVVPFLLEDRLVERGARFEGAAMWQEKVAISERLVTGQNPASAAGVARAMVTVLRGQTR
jgi:putative intracellular protease/amidase